MSAVQKEEAKTFTVTRCEHGCAHKKLWGTFTGPVTAQDVADEFYDPYFGGRDAQVDHVSKTFYVVMHID